MKEISTVIIEDEQVSRETLFNYLTKYCPSVQVLGMADNIKEGLNLIQQKRPQLVFLDVEMPYGSGFDLLDQIEEIDFEVIFVTAFSQYAIQALNLSAAYYLLKPVDIDELVQAVERVSEQIEQNQLIQSARILKTNLQVVEHRLKRIVLPEMEGFEVAQLKDIVYCKANDNLTDFFFADGKKKTICKTLKHFDQVLGESGFFRAHKSYLINLEHVNGYRKGKGGYAQMANGDEVEIAVRRKPEFLKQFVG